MIGFGHFGGGGHSGGGHPGISQLKTMTPPLNSPSPSPVTTVGEALGNGFAAGVSAGSGLAMLLANRQRDHGPAN
jgi:hypothetical protein